MLSICAIERVRSKKSKADKREKPLAGMMMNKEGLARISHTHSSRDAARTRPCSRSEAETDDSQSRPKGAEGINARTVSPAGLYENILSKGDSGRNEAGAGRSQSQQNGHEKCGLGSGNSPMSHDPALSRCFNFEGTVNFEGTRSVTILFP